MLVPIRVCAAAYKLLGHRRIEPSNALKIEGSVSPALRAGIVPISAFPTFQGYPILSSDVRGRILVLRRPVRCARAGGHTSFRRCLGGCAQKCQKVRITSNMYPYSDTPSMTRSTPRFGFPKREATEEPTLSSLRISRYFRYYRPNLRQAGHLSVNADLSIGFSRWEEICAAGTRRRSASRSSWDGFFCRDIRSDCCGRGAIYHEIDGGLPDGRCARELREGAAGKERNGFGWVA